MKYTVIKDTKINGVQYHIGDVVDESSFKKITPITTEQEHQMKINGTPLEVSEVETLLTIDKSIR